MTPKEYKMVWDQYMQSDDPFFVSEHRRSYPNCDEWTDVIEDEADITLFGISAARIGMMAAAKRLREDGYKVNEKHIIWLKPFPVADMAQALSHSEKALLVDNGFPICGAARNLAYELIEKTGKFVKAVACEDHVKCMNSSQQNRTPDAEKIYQEAIKLLTEKQ